MVTVEPFEECPNCSQKRFDFAVDVAKRLEKERGATNIRVWYDPNEDFTRIEFHLDGDRYDVRIYKVFGVVKNGDDRFVNTRSFPHEYQFFTFFECGRHKVWNLNA